MSRHNLKTARNALLVAVAAYLASACGAATTRPTETPPAPAERHAAGKKETPTRAQCGGAPMRVRFYDAGQALAAIILLPDGRRVLVDAGENPTRAGCGPACREWHQRVMDGLRRDVGAGPLDLIWISHQHSDHVGGAPDVLAAFHPGFYVDNGMGLAETKTVAAARSTADSTRSQVRVIDLEQPHVPLADTESVKFTALVPRAWPSSCSRDPNACSLGLRIDYCASSVVFTGDATADEEAVLDLHGTANLIQVAHHGSDTSSSDAFLAAAKPQYAVISAARPDEGTNRTYCHPRAVTVERLTRALGGSGSRSMRAFDGAVRCNSKAASEHWVDVPASDRLWLTARDGEISLVTMGDGVFVRE